ncbi:MAG: DUF188 domain-containing protein [Tissierellales bacterium]
MKIIIDADGCPVVDLTIKIAKEYNLGVTIVKNYAHEIYDDYATIVTVDLSPDSADYYIVNITEDNDIIVTQDYGLAAMVLSKLGICINQNGLIISKDNIDQLLSRRHLHSELRRKHKYYTKAKKRKSIDNVQFERNLRILIEGIVIEN